MNCTPILATVLRDKPVPEVTYMFVFTLVCMVACVVLVWAEYKKQGRARTISKTVASLAFIAIGLLAYKTTATSVAMWIVIGLVLGAIGDVALLGKGDRAFMTGLVAFLGGHIAYVVAIATALPMSQWVDAAALVPIVGGALVLASLWPNLGDMKIPVIVYVLTIVTMVIGALALWHPALTTGAVLFFVSDIAVARDKFVASEFSNRAWGLPCYYAGQLFIAWSIRG